MFGYAGNKSEVRELAWQIIKILTLSIGKPLPEIEIKDEAGASKPIAIGVSFSTLRVENATMGSPSPRSFPAISITYLWP